MIYRSMRRACFAVLAVGAVACSNDNNNNNGADASVSTGGSGGSGGRAGGAGVSGGGSSGRGGSGGSTGGSTGVSDASTGGRGTAGAGGKSTDAGVPEAGLSDAAVDAFSPAEWIALLDTVNGGEVQQGEVATAKAQAADVKSFAGEMVTDHTRGLEKDSAVASALGITPKQTRVSADLKSQSNKLLATLNGLTGTAFDRAYMQAQVSQHGAVLALLDSGIIAMGGSPDASVPDAGTPTSLLGLLEATRAVVKEHLQMANAIVAGLP